MTPAAVGIWELIAFLIEIFRMIRGTPADRQRRLLERIREQGKSFRETGDTSDLGRFD